MKCPACGSENREGAKFCSECGASLTAAPGPAREERKVVTVLFCDLVGSTARADGADPEDVRALLSAYHERVRHELERFGGTVEKFIGDAVMAVFGAPIVHEDDPERAVRAGLAIREWAQEEEDLQIRIGITTGEALVALGARPETGEGFVAGDVVNTAARLQAAAPENGILVDETTFRATERVIDHADHPPITAKGKAKPVAVWRPLDARARVRVEREDRTPLVGREKELAVLLAALERVRAEGEPQLVTLVGVPGIGKSRLVYELFKSVESRDELTFWRHGRSLPYGQGISFWALSEMVKAQAGILDSDTGEQAAEKLRRAVDPLVHDEADWLEAQLRPLVGLGGERSLGGDAQAEAFAAWRRFLEALAEQRPLVLVFEDLHWADDGLLDFVDYLVEWASAVPILVVCTARPELLARRAGWGGGKPNAATVSLSSLSDEETARLLASVLGRSVLPAETQKALLERAGGNPLYAEEFARLVTERAHADDARSVPLPESVQGIIAARLDALPDDEKALLQEAAVLGRAFWIGALVDAAGDRTAVERRLHALERKEFVRRERRSTVAGETEYAFRHLLVRDGAYGQIPRSRRGEKHERVAAWIETLSPDRSEDRAEMLAQHYLAALELAKATGQSTGPLGERARLALREAGDRASGLNSHRAAARYYEEALALWPDHDPERSELLFQLARARHLAGDVLAEQTLDEAAAALLAAGLAERAAEAEALLAEAAWFGHDLDRSDAHLDRAGRLVAELPASAEKARVLSQIARYRSLAGDAETAIALASEALAMARALELVDVQAQALANIGIARTKAGDSGALEDLRSSAEIALAARSPDAGRALQNLAVTHWWLGDLRQCRTVLLEAVRVCEEMGLARQLAFTRGNYASLLIAAGEWDEGLPIVEELIAASERGRQSGIEHRLYGRRATVRLARGDEQRAREDVEMMLTFAHQRDPSRLQALALATRIYAESGLEAGAERLAAELLRDVDRPGGRDYMLIDFAWVADALGFRDPLAQHLAGDPRGTLWGRAATALLQADFESAAELFDKMGEALEGAIARIHAADALVARGLRAEADDQLRRALPFLRTLRATRYVHRGERLLAASA